MKHIRTRAVLPAVLALQPILLSSQALAQEDAPGLVGVLSFSQRLDYSDNPDFVVDPDGGAFEPRTDLGFTLSSVTRTETFRLSLGTVYEGAFDDDANDFEFVRDTASVTYVREGIASRLELGANYLETELDDDIIEVVFDPDDLIIDGGSRQRLSASATFETGLNAPFGFRLSTAYSDVSYQDTTDDDLEDSEEFSVDALARFQLTRTLNARALAGWSRETEDDATATERTRRYVGFGLGGETRGGLSFSADITYDEVETDRTTGTETTDGVGIDLSVSQARPNGSIGASLSSRVDEDGRLTQARISRALDLPDGQLSFSLGVIDSDDADLRPIASLSYSRETKRGALVATLSQTPTTDDGESVVNTALRVNYSSEINNISGWSAALAYSESNELGSEDDASRASATLSYRRNLTKDWDLRAGVTHARRESSDEAERTENSIFLSLERDFSFGF